MRSPQSQAATGFTLIEALLAATILAIAVVAVLLPFTGALHCQAADLRQTMALNLAEELMEEILNKSFEEPDDADEKAEPLTAFGPEGNEGSRKSFDAIDDYHNYTEAAGSIVGPDGQVVTDPAAAGLSRTVTAAYVTVSGQAGGGEPCFLQVIVTVKHNNQPLVTLTRLVHWLK